jgi:hypothetical protein
MYDQNEHKFYISYYLQFNNELIKFVMFYKILFLYNVILFTILTP